MSRKKPTTTRPANPNTMIDTGTDDENPPPPPSQQQQPQQHYQYSRARMDGGWGWVVVAAGFIISAVLDGVGFSVGILFSSLRNQFGSSHQQISWMSSVLNGTYLLIGPLVSVFLNRYGCRKVSVLGCVITSLSFVISTFCPSIPLVIVTYGLVGGVGLGFLYIPSIVIIGHYFYVKRALALGITSCGSGIGAFALAPLFSLFVDHYGWTGATYLASALVLLCVCACSTFRPIDTLKTGAGISSESAEAAGDLSTRSTSVDITLRDEEGDDVVGTLVKEEGLVIDAEGRLSDSQVSVLDSLDISDRYGKRTESDAQELRTTEPSEHRTIENAVGVGRVAQASATQAGAKSVDATQANAKSVDATQASAKSVDATQANAKSVDATQANAKSVDATQANAKSVDATQANAKSVDATQAGAKSVDATQANAKSVDATQAGAKSVDATQANAKSVDATQAGAKSVDATQANAKSVDATQANAKSVDATQASAKSGDAMQADATSAGAMSENVIQKGATSADATQAGATQAGATQAGATQAGAGEGKVTSEKGAMSNNVSSDTVHTGPNVKSYGEAGKMAEVGAHQDTNTATSISEEENKTKSVPRAERITQKEEAVDLFFLREKRITSVDEKEKVLEAMIQNDKEIEAKLEGSKVDGDNAASQIFRLSQVCGTPIDELDIVSCLPCSDIHSKEEIASSPLDANEIQTKVLQEGFMNSEHSTVTGWPRIVVGSTTSMNLNSVSRPKKAYSDLPFYGYDISDLTISVTNRPESCIYNHFNRFVWVPVKLNLCLMKRPSAVVYFTACFLMSVGMYVPTTFLPPVAEVLKFESSKGAFLVSTVGIGNVVARLLTGVIAHHCPRHVLTLNNGSLIFAGIFTCLLPILTEYYLMVAYSFLFGASVGVFVVVQVMVLIELLGLDNLNNAFGLVNMYHGIGTFVGPPLAGFVADFTGDIYYAFYTIGAIFTLAGLICLPLYTISLSECREARGSLAVIDLQMHSS